MSPPLPRIRKIFGPLKTTREHDRVVWSFTGYRENGELARWTLRFHFKTRKFSVRAVSPKHGDDKFRTPGLFPAYEAAEVNVSRIGPLLRARLKPEHIAEATRLALKHGAKP